jgi:hypothetical protein
MICRSSYGPKPGYNIDEIFLIVRWNPLMISIVFEIARKEVICLRNLRICKISQFFANRKFSPYFYGLLKRDLKFLKLCCWFYAQSTMCLSKLLILIFSVAACVTLSLHFLQQILLHLGKLNLRNDPLLF